jgi:hypothetical protein
MSLANNGQADNWIFDKGYKTPGTGCRESFASAGIKNMVKKRKSPDRGAIRTLLRGV